MNKLAGRRVHVIAGGVMAVLLAGCQAVTDDPREGGFVTGLLNIFSGGYDDRIAREEMIVQAQQEEQTALAKQTAEVERERDRLAKDLAAADTRIADIQATIQRHKVRLAVLKAERRSEYKSEYLLVAAMETRLGAVQTQLGRAKDPAQPVAAARGQIAEAMSGLTDLEALSNQIARQ